MKINLLKALNFVLFKGIFEIMVRLIIVIVLILHVICLKAQNYPKNYFRHPVDGKLSIAGTFGELRSYHFHMGLDIKANEGTPIKASAEGYLARIKVSESGYGKVMYVNHPNGYSTVYAHLSRFSDTINKFIKAKQYELQSEEVDLYLPDSLFKFKKGELIAYSGNTGHSAGPHLHFEIRDAKTDEAFNPLLFGIKVRDEVKPEIQGLKFYPLDETSTVEGKPEAKYYSLKLGKTASFKNAITIQAYGTIGIAVQAHDHTSESNSRCGIYELQICENNEQKFCQRISNIGFDVTRYINTYKDYDEFHKNNRHLHKSFIQGNNKLNIYPDKNKSGFLKIEGKDTLRYYVKAMDAAGNIDSVFVNIVPLKTEVKKKEEKPCQLPILWKEDFVYSNEGIDIKISSGSTYDNDCFHYYTKKKTNKTFSRFHAFYASGTPLQEEFQLKIKPDSIIPEALVSKILIVRSRDLKDMSPYDTKFENGTFTASPRSFGTFSLVVDTLAPIIKVNGYTDSVAFSKASTKELSFEMKDDLAGIKTFKLFVNGEWILTHYNMKKNKVIFQPSEMKWPAGYYPIRFELVDKKGNVAEFKGVIKWLV